jgi:hypothetical protein
MAVESLGEIGCHAMSDLFANKLTSLNRVQFAPSPYGTSFEAALYHYFPQDVIKRKHCDHEKSISVF